MHRQLPIHQEVCQPLFGRRDVTKLQPGLPFCHPRAATDDFSALLFGESEKTYYICIPIRHRAVEMVDVAQSVRASDCGSEGRGFEPLLPPHFSRTRRPTKLDAFVLSGCGQAKSGLPCRIPTKTLPAEAVLFSEAPLTDRGCGAKRFPFQWPPRDCCAVRAPSSTPIFQEQGVQQNWTPLFCRENRGLTDGLPANHGRTNPIRCRAKGMTQAGGWFRPSSSRM